MTKVYVRDSNLFSEQCPTKRSLYFDWVWDRTPQDRPVTIFSDCHIQEVENSRSAVKIAWLIEPPIINSFIYAYVAKNYRYFDAIATYDDRLLSLDSRFLFLPLGYLLGS